MTGAVVYDLDAARRRQRARGPYAPDPWRQLAWIGQTDRRDAIRLYTDCGLHPIAIHGVREDGSCTCGRRDCPSVGKHPVHRGWQTADLDLARLDADLIREWRYNVGLRMGVQPGGFRLIAIDVDGPRSLLEPLEAVNGPLPPTLTARTGRGGSHLIYRVPLDLEISNRTHLAPNVDVKSDRGQIVVAPSLHASGRHYAWVECREPEVLP
ncbi:MAG: bifunctional DNA primase/polymerase [Polyangiaceae bacterium]|nr:bifunctional DNA primase/polymerase [Polyangiaceae bacterium]